MASALVAVVAVGLSRLMGGMSRATASLERRSEVVEARQVIARRLNCKRTFPGGVCAPAANGLVPLLDDFGQPILTQTELTVAPFAPSFQLGRTQIRTSCGAGALEIRYLHRLDAARGWPGVPAVSTCQEVLGGTFQHECPANHFMRGINPLTLEPICQALNFTPCPFGTYAVGILPNTLAPNCVPFNLGQCPPNTVAVGLEPTTLAPRCIAPPLLFRSQSGYLVHDSPNPLNPHGSSRSTDIHTDWDIAEVFCATPTDTRMGVHYNCTCQIQKAGPRHAHISVHLSHGAHGGPVQCSGQWLILGHQPPP